MLACIHINFKYLYFNRIGNSARHNSKNGEKKMEKKTFGFKEWTKHSVNCCSGCSNNCRYCYAKGMAVRFGQMTPEEWSLERIREKDVLRKQKLYDGRVMFPSSHDITPGNLDACVVVIGKLLAAGNDLLIVSKPRIKCIERICREFEKFNDQILFRFTIGAMDNGILSFWEPNAPFYEERHICLQLARAYHFATSVSIEPMLDPASVVPMVADLEPFVTDAIWIGKMNHIQKNLKIADPETAEALTDMEGKQTDEAILRIYEQLKDHPLIKWKESIKTIVGIELPKEQGLDE
jgi:DNA repair photolyase